LPFDMVNGIVLTRSLSSHLRFFSCLCLFSDSGPGLLGSRERLFRFFFFFLSFLSLSNLLIGCSSSCSSAGRSSGISSFANPMKHLKLCHFSPNQLRGSSSSCG